MVNTISRFVSLSAVLSIKRVVDPAVDLIARRSPFFLKFHIAAVRLATITQGGSTRYRSINQIERSIVIGLKQSDCVQQEGARHWYLSRTGWGSGGSMRAVLVRIHDCGPHDCGLDRNSISSQTKEVIVASIHTAGSIELRVDVVLILEGNGRDGTRRVTWYPCWIVSKSYHARHQL